MKYSFNKYNIFQILIFVSMAIAQLGPIGSIRCSAIGWAVPLLFSLFLITTDKYFKIKRFAIWYPWITYITISSIFSEHEDSIKMSLIAITPIIVGATASTHIIDKENIHKLIQFLSLFSITVISIISIKIIINPDILYKLPAESITIVGLLWIFWQLYKFDNRIRHIALWFIMLLIPILSASRMPIISGLISIIPSLNKKIKLSKIIAVCTFLLVMVLSISTLPAIKNKMVYSGSDITDILERPDIIQTSGRAYIWQLIYIQALEKPIFGHGAGSTSTYLKPFSASFAHPHNDWLRLFYEFGFFGIFVFVITNIVQIVKLILIYKNSHIPELRLVSYLSLILFIPLYLLMITDNILYYSAFFGNLHFLLIGTSISLSYSQNIEK